LALLGDGTVLAWGDNREGQLGLGSVANSLVPTSLVGLGGVTEIAAGGRRSLARTAAGLQGWGDGEFSPQSVGGDLSLATLGGESGVDSRSYGLGIARAFYAYDPQGNVRALTDGTGALAASYTYDAYGNLLSPSSTSTLNFNPYLFQGERFEAAAGLYHLRARDYDPHLGRFQQLDSFEGVPGQPFSHNRYTYSEADPVNLHDPSGHYAVTVWQALQLLDQQVAYNDFLASIGPKEQLLDIGAYSGNYAYAMGSRPQVVQRERPIWLMASGSGSILGSLEDESGAKTEKNFTRGLGVGSNVFFLAQTGSPVRTSVVERLVDSAWLATQRAWPNLNTGPKLPGDVRAQFSLKWQNRWPDVVYHNAILQGGLRSALLGREVEAFATVTFRPPTILPQTRSAMALRALNGVSGGGPLDWRASAASAEGAFLSKVSASGWEYGQMEMMQDWTAAALGSDAYRFALHPVHSLLERTVGAARDTFFARALSSPTGVGTTINYLAGAVLNTVDGVAGSVLGIPERFVDHYGDAKLAGAGFGSSMTYALGGVAPGVSSLYGAAGFDYGSGAELSTGQRWLSAGTFALEALGTAAALPGRSFAGTLRAEARALGAVEEAGVGATGRRVFNPADFADDVARIRAGALERYGPGEGIVNMAGAAESAINPRLANRLDAWRAYKSGGGAMDMKQWVKATQRQYGGVSGGYQSGYRNWSRRIDVIQEHHLIPNKASRALTRRGIDGDALRARADLIYDTAPGRHFGYEDWHRSLDTEIVDYIRTTPDLTQDSFMQYLQQLYRRPDLADRIPGVDLGF
jgi:RHS repeat-associated protein